MSNIILVDYLPGIQIDQVKTLVGRRLTEVQYRNNIVYQINGILQFIPSTECKMECLKGHGLIVYLLIYIPCIAFGFTCVIREAAGKTSNCENRKKEYQHDYLHHSPLI